MSSQTRIDDLDDRQVLLVLSHLTEELGEDVPTEPGRSVASEDEARLAIEALLEAGGEAVPAPDEIVASDAEAVALGRDLLEELLREEATREQTAALVESPPADTTMSIELAIGGAIVLGALISWLQTKVDIEITRDKGQTSFRFRIGKDAADPEVIGDVAKTVGRLLGSG